MSPMVKPIKYVIVTPVRDEETHLPKTIDSVLKQTCQPAEWIIVNDGSSDGTRSVVDQAAAGCVWLRGLHRPNRGHRKSGGGVIEAFNDGYDALSCRDWNFLVKLDGDLSFEPTYFERTFEHFEQEPQLGIGGGSIYNFVQDKLVLEDCPKFHVRGATKIYRRGCWDVLGGLMKAPGWDTIDEIKAQQHGWQTRTFPELALAHHRQTGAADGLWGGLVKNGRANYICGYHPAFMAAKCLARLVRPPRLIGSAALAYGFIGGYLSRTPQIDDPELIQYLRVQQIRRLTGRKSIWH